MNINIKNLAPIQECSIDLNRLTIIAGMNNTGKSIVLRTIHALFNKNINLDLIKGFMVQSEFMGSAYQYISSKRNHTISFPKNIIVQIINSLFDYYIENMDSNKIFENIYRSDTMIEPDKNLLIKKSLSEYYDEDKLYRNFCYLEFNAIDSDTISLKKLKNSQSVEISMDPTYFVDKKFNTEKFAAISDYFSRLFLKLNLFTQEIIPFPAERSGLILSDYNHNQYNFMISEYLNIIHSIDSNVENKNKDILAVAKYMEKNILRGTITTKDNKLCFIDTISKESINMSGVSSSVRELAGIIAYLKYKANTRDMIVVDEPELSLHPDGIRYFIRAVSMLINQGLKVILITHSDYIIKEINNLILLSNDNVKYNYGDLVSEKLYFENINDIQLDYKKVSMYTFILNDKKKIIVKPVDNDENGFYEELFNKTIYKLNKTEDLMFKMMKKLGKYSDD